MNFVNFLRSLLFCAFLSLSCVSLEQTDSMMETAGRSLQSYFGDQRCNKIEERLNGTVSCKCAKTRSTTQFLTVDKTWECQYKEKKCNKRNTCSVPWYRGTTQFRPHLFSPVMVRTEYCAYDYTNPTLIPDFTFPTMCIQVDVCLSVVGAYDICGCGATYGGRNCTSCESCLGGAGIRVKCQDWPIGVCIPTVLPTPNLGGRTSSNQKSYIEQVVSVPFIPDN